LRRSFAVFAALGLMAVLSLPALGMPVAARDPLEIKLLSPLANRSEWYGGAVIPLRVNVTDPDFGSGDLGEGREGANVTVWVNAQPATGTGLNMGNVMKDMGGGIYQFNLKTKPYPAGPGTEPIHIVIIAETGDDHAGEIEVLIHLN